MTLPNQIGIPPGVPTNTPMLQVKDSSLAIASLISGIVGWILVPIFGALTAIITGHLAKKEINEGNGLITGNGMATAGLILGYVQLGFVILAIIAIAVIVLISGRA